MSYRRSGVKGATSFRRLLRQLPASADQKCIELLNRAGPILTARMKARIPFRTGFGRGGISYRVTPSTKTLKVGVLVPKLSRSDYFYLHILDVGRRSQLVLAHHKNGNTYRLQVRSMKPLRIVAQGAGDFRSEFLPNYRALMDVILLDAARGAGDD